MGRRTWTSPTRSDSCSRRRGMSDEAARREVHYVSVVEDGGLWLRAKVRRGGEAGGMTRILPGRHDEAHESSDAARQVCAYCSPCRQAQTHTSARKPRLRAQSRGRPPGGRPALPRPARCHRAAEPPRHALPSLSDCSHTQPDPLHRARAAAGGARASVGPHRAGACCATHRAHGPAPCGGKDAREQCAPRDGILAAIWACARVEEGERARASGGDRAGPHRSLVELACAAAGRRKLS